jgi:hypothetical protein
MGTAHWEDEGLLGSEDLRVLARENLLQEVRLYSVAVPEIKPALVDWIAEELERLNGLAGAW